MDAAELGGDAPPGGAAAPFADTHQQEGEPAQQQHVSADAGLDAVEHGPQLEGGREVPEPAFGFEQVLVAEGHVFGGEVGVAGGQQVLAAEAFLGADASPVDDSRPVELWRR